MAMASLLISSSTVGPLESIPVKTVTVILSTCSSDPAAFWLKGPPNCLKIAQKTLTFGSLFHGPYASDFLMICAWKSLVCLLSFSPRWPLLIFTVAIFGSCCFFLFGDSVLDSSVPLLCLQITADLIWYRLWSSLTWRSISLPLVTHTLYKPLITNYEGKKVWVEEQFGDILLCQCKSDPGQYWKGVEE